MFTLLKPKKVLIFLRRLDVRHWGGGLRGRIGSVLLWGGGGVIIQRPKGDGRTGRGVQGSVTERHTIRHLQNPSRASASWNQTLGGEYRLSAPAFSDGAGRNVPRRAHFLLL